MRWLWANSAAVCEEKSTVISPRRVQFFVKAFLVYSSVKQLIDAPRASPLGKLIQDRPQVVGAVMWPYQCAGWSPRTRLARIRDHYAVVEKIGGAIDFPVDGKISLLDLGSIHEGLHVVIDQPVWFMREGQLAINLFLGDIRMYTLAFSFFHHENTIAAFIGAIQGRDIEGVLKEYRNLTKSSYGMRPRDFLIELFRMFCAELGVTQIFAVSDEYRHHRDRRYFGQASGKKFTANYNEVWTERGGVRVDPMFFRLDISDPGRDLAAIPSKKRSMYRRRFEMLRNLRGQMHVRCIKTETSIIPI